MKNALPIIISTVLISFLTTTTFANEKRSTVKVKHSDGVSESAFTVYNGRLWKAIDKQTKIFYLNAFFESFALFSIQMREDKEKAEILNSLDKSGDKLSIKGFRYSDLVQQVDMVYADSSNLRIPIVEAYRYILKKLRGASPETLANEIAKLRKSYNI